MLNSLKLKFKKLQFHSYLMLYQCSQRVYKNSLNLKLQHHFDFFLKNLFYTYLMLAKTQMF